MLCITETWLKPITVDGLLTDDCHYSVYRTDRLLPATCGGGVCILTNNDTIKAIFVPLPPMYLHVELCTIDLLLHDSKLRLFVCYRPTSGNTDPDALQYVKDLRACIDSLMPAHSQILICGDLNLPNIDWSIDNSVRCSDATCSGVFLDLYYNHGLKQFVTEPTRLDNILDLVLSNDNNCVFNVRSVEPFGTSDHSQICFDVLYSSQQCTSTSVIRNFKHADWAKIRSFLDKVDFYSLFNSNLPAKLIMSIFYDIIRSSLDQFVPNKRLAVSRRSNYIHYPYRIRRLILKKSTAWRTHRNFKTKESLESYKCIAHECKFTIDDFIANYENNLTVNGNLGDFFRYANNKFCCKSTIGPIQDSTGYFTTDPKRKAEILQRAFQNNYTTDNGNLPSMEKRTSSELCRAYFTPSLVRRVIKKLNIKTKGGPDEIPPIFFKNCCDELSYPLALFFTFSFENSILPEVWLKSFITPIFKKGNSSDPNNYRPISLTCTMCKIMESIIKDQLVQYLNNKGLISKYQHAFIKNHSTATNILESINDWLVGIKSPNCTDVVYIDFSKAFDSIVISKLLLKLHCYGISGLLLSWIKCFLSDRTQCVVVDRCQSLFNKVTSGVPQGSVLGPILFILYINDIDCVCCGNVKLQLFADDAKIYSSINIDRASVSLQQSLDNLCHWASDWQLVINISKCAVLSVCSKPLLTDHAYSINGIVVTHHNSYNDLGITVCQNLSFNGHINNIVSRARQRVSILFRGFSSRNCNVLRRAYITYVRPIVEYNTIVWNPCVKYLIDIIERVQRNFSKRIPSLSSMTYAERLAFLNLETLELRRLHFDLIFYYKVFNHLAPFDPETLFSMHTPPPNLRSSSEVVKMPFKSSDKLVSGIFYRSIDAWNSLPLDVRFTPTLPCFKRRIKCIDFSVYLKGSINSE